MAVSAMVEAGLVSLCAEELMSRLGPLLARREPYRTCWDYLQALMLDLPRVNCWTLAEHAGHASPDRMQHLLERASWDIQAARQAVGGFVVEQLACEDAVLVFDESGDEKAGRHTVGVDRQYTGTAGKVTNCVNAVYCTYASRLGHALCDVRLYLPKTWAGDQARREAAGVPEQVAFATRPALASAMLAEHLAAGTRFRWVAADAVYGRDPNFRATIEKTGKGYVLQVPRDFRLTLGCGARVRAEQAAQLIEDQPWPNLYSAGLGSKGERLSRWGWIGTASARHSLLIRQSLSDPEELAYYWCYAPDDQPAPLPVLVKVAGMRWPVEEDLKHGKQHAALTDSQVRTWTAWHRHQLLSIAALAIKATAAAQARRPHTPPPLPQAPDQPPPADLPPIRLTVPQIGRLHTILTRIWRPIQHHLHWSLWRHRKTVPATPSSLVARIAQRLGHRARSPRPAWCSAPADQPAVRGGVRGAGRGQVADRDRGVGRRRPRRGAGPARRAHRPTDRRRAPSR
jgi:SRSO17 transposase